MKIFQYLILSLCLSFHAQAVLNSIDISDCFSNIGIVRNYAVKTNFNVSGGILSTIDGLVSAPSSSNISIPNDFVERQWWSITCNTPSNGTFRIPLNQNPNSSTGSDWAMVSVTAFSMCTQLNTGSISSPSSSNGTTDFKNFSNSLKTLLPNNLIGVNFEKVHSSSGVFLRFHGTDPVSGSIFYFSLFGSFVFPAT